MDDLKSKVDKALQILANGVITPKQIEVLAECIKEVQTYLVQVSTVKQEQPLVVDDPKNETSEVVDEIDTKEKAAEPFKIPKTTRVR